MSDHPEPDTTTRTTMGPAWLASLGLGDLPGPAQADLLKTAYTTLENRVGQRIARRFSSEDLEQFEKIFQRHDDQAALAFLDQKFPDHPLIVKAEIRRLETEIRQAAPVILAELARTTQTPAVKPGPHHQPTMSAPSGQRSPMSTHPPSPGAGWDHPEDGPAPPTAPHLFDAPHLLDASPEPRQGTPRDQLR